MKVPNTFIPEEIANDVNCNSASIDDKWVPLRPMGYNTYGFFHRLICAWKVFIGKADIVEWYKQ